MNKLKKKSERKNYYLLFQNQPYFSNVIQYLISVSKIVSLLAGSLIKNGLLLDKGKSVESKFSIFLVCKYAVINMKKEQVCVVFQSQSMKVCIGASF